MGSQETGYKELYNLTTWQQHVNINSSSLSCNEEANVNKSNVL